MINRMLLAFLSVLVAATMFASPVPAGTHDGAKAGDIRDAGSRYDTLLEKVVGHVKSKDPSWGDKEASKAFRELRFAYTGTSAYNPYGGIKTEAGPKMWEAVNNKKYDQALQYAERILKEDFVDLDAHMVASTAYRKTGNKEKADYHSALVNMLVLSILNDGAGDKPETAMEVISTDEEYAILNVAGLRAKSQALVSANGHNYDKLIVVDPVSGKTFEMYFCIDKPVNWLQDSFKKHGTQ